ncbi:MAG: hypothetical protein Q7T97_02455 [Burkholderiaceae bacterium]|nr:hypothetical protein [Burkholderiaceae bacterium]
MLIRQGSLDGHVDTGTQPAARWLDRGLVCADQLTGYPSNSITGLVDTIVGAKVTASKWGLARGFSSAGSGATDRIATTLSSDSTLRTYIVRYSRAGAGGSSLGRLFSRASVECYWENASSWIRFSAAHSTTAGNWRAPATTAGGNAANTPYVLAIRYNSSSVANIPLISVNGVSVVVSVLNAPVGTPAASTTPIYIGNTASSNRVWDGLTSDFLVFDSILSDGEIAELADPSQLWQERRIWIPVSAGGAVLINCTAGNAAADGVAAKIDQARLIAATVGNAAAAGVDAQIITTGAVLISATPGNAVAAGVTAQIDQARIISATVGNAVAAGVDASITTASGVVISATPGDAVAAGVTAALISNVLVNAGPGNAAASGVDSLITNGGIAATGGGGGGGRIRRNAKRQPKPKYLVEVDGKFIVVASKEEAREALQPKKPAKPSKKVKQAEHAPVISLQAVHDYADLIGKADQYTAAMQSRHYQDILALFDQMQRDDEDDVEMLLLSL